MVNSTEGTNIVGLNGNIQPATFSALKNSLYPGAKDESIHMVLEYCRAAQIDPMLKPVHIVPMTVKDPITGNYIERDVIMPGVGLYRIQAERSGCYAGISEPEYGPDVTMDIAGCMITYPEWCRVIVKKLVQGQLCEFSSGKQYWKENYGAKKSGQPTPMWIKRPYEQLAKCSEAQALRKAFPGIIAQAPTAEEMDGKSYNMEQPALEVPRHTGDIVKEKLKARLPLELKQEISVATPLDTSFISKDTHEELQVLIERLSIDEQQIAKWLKKADAKTLYELTEPQATAIIDHLLKKMQ